MIVDKSDILQDRRRRQSNQGRQQFKEESLAEEIISLYLRYRDSNLHNMNEIKNIVVENLVHCQVIKRMENSLELTGKLTRLQCSKCFYISYLSDNEPRNCLRCSSFDLRDFPKKK